MLTAATVKSLPRPSDAQWRAFKDHLYGGHSWYKHLPLFDGGEFVVFLAPDAGEKYPLLHPRLPTENTLDGYRRAFGHLDYIYRAHPNEPFGRDGSAAPQLDDEILKFCRFNLYPFVSAEFYWSVHKQDVARIRNGAKHPRAAAILDAYDAEQQMEQCWDQISDSDRDEIYEIDDTETALREQSFNDSILRYLEFQESAADSYLKLHLPEIQKLERCVDDVQQWLA